MLLAWSTWEEWSFPKLESRFFFFSFARLRHSNISLFLCLTVRSALFWEPKQTIKGLKRRHYESSSSATFTPPRFTAGRHSDSSIVPERARSLSGPRSEHRQKIRFTLCQELLSKVAPPFGRTLNLWMRARVKLELEWERGGVLKLD